MYEGMLQPRSVISTRSTEGGLKPHAKFCFLSEMGILGRRVGEWREGYLLNQIIGNVSDLEVLTVFVQ